MLITMKTHFITSHRKWNCFFFFPFASPFLFFSSFPPLTSCFVSLLSNERLTQVSRSNVSFIFRKRTTNSLHVTLITYIIQNSLYCHCRVPLTILLSLKPLDLDSKFFYETEKSWLRINWIKINAKTLNKTPNNTNSKSISQLPSVLPKPHSKSDLLPPQNMTSQEDLSALREEMHNLVVNSINNLRETLSVSHQASNQSLAAITQHLDDSNLSNTRLHNYLRHIAEGANSWGERSHNYSHLYSSKYFVLFM